MLRFNYILAGCSACTVGMRMQDALMDLHRTTNMHATWSTCMPFHSYMIYHPHARLSLQLHFHVDVKIAWPIGCLHAAESRSTFK